MTWFSEWSDENAKRLKRIKELQEKVNSKETGLGSDLLTHFQQGLTFLEPISGPLDTIGSFTNAAAYNATLRNVERAKEENARGAKVYGPSWLGATAAVLAVSPLDAFDASTWDRPEGAVNPFEEAKKATQGRLRVGGVEAIKKVAETYPGLTPEQRDAMGSEWSTLLGGTVLDIGRDITTYGSGGMSALAKAGKIDKMNDITKGGVTAAKLADIGMNVAETAAKHGDEYAEITKGGSLLDDLASGVPAPNIPPAMTRDIEKAAQTFAGQALEGTERVINKPFVRKLSQTGEEGAYNWSPVLRKLKEGEESKTLLGRLGRKVDVAEYGKLAEKAQETGDVLERVPLLNLGKRSADRGGIKLLGETVIDAQPYFDAAKDALRRVTIEDKGARGEISRIVGGLVSNYMDVDKHGNRLLSAYFRRKGINALGMAKRAGTEEGVEFGVETTIQTKPRELVAMQATVEEVIGPEAWSRADELYKQRDFNVRSRDMVARKQGLITEESIEAARGGVASQAARANTAVENIADEQAAILEQMADISERAGGAKTASTLRAEAAALRGEAQGTKRAVGETDRAVRDAVADAERFGEREMRFGQKATDAGYAAPVAKAEMPEGSLYPPRTLDEYITSTYSPAGDEAVNEGQQVFDEIRSYMRQHNAAIDDGNEVGAEMAEAFSRIPGLNNLRASHRFNAKRTAIPADTIREHLGQMFPQFTGMGEGDFLNEIERLATASRSSMGRFGVDDLIEQAGSDNIIDALVTKVDEAIEAGDLTAAKAWQVHVDEFARRSQPFSEEGLLGMSDAKRLAERAVAKRRAALRAQESRTKLAQAYKSGRATGYAETSRLAGADAVRAERKAAKASGRQADYGTIIDRLQDTAGKKQTAYEAMRKLESEYRSLDKRRTSWMAQMSKGMGDINSLERSLDLIAKKENMIAAIDEAITEIVGTTSWDRVRAGLVKLDIEPERADELVAIMRDTTAKLEENNAARRALNIQEAEILKGTSMGYTPHYRQLKDTWYERLREKVGKPTEYQAARDEIVQRMSGKTWDELGEQERRYSLGASNKPVKPDFGAKRTAGMTLRDRFAQKDVPAQVDMNYARVNAAKMQKDSVDIAKAEFEDGFVRDMGLRPAENMEPADAALFANQMKQQGFVPWVTKRTNGDVTYYIPEDIAKHIDKMTKIITHDESVGALLRGVDKMMTLWKKLNTVVKVQFHLRNAPSNYVLAWMKDANLADIGSWSDAIKARIAYHGGSGDTMKVKVGSDGWLTANELMDLVNGSVIRGDVGYAGDMGSTIAKTVKARAPRESLIGEVGRELNPFATGQKVGSEIEDTSRLGVYLAARNKLGLSHNAGVDIVDSTLYNYLPENLTPTERGVKRWVAPFYTWSKANIPNMLEISVKQPGKVNWLTKLRESAYSATGTDPTLVPDYIKEQGGIPLPGEGESGGQMFVNPSMVPSTDQNRLAGDAGALFNSLGPIKLPAEFKSNRDWYYGEDISDYTGDKTRAPGVFQVIEQAAAGKKPWESVKKMLNMATHTNKKTGERYVAMDPYAAKALKDLTGGIYTLLNFPDPRPQGKYTRISALTGIKLTELDEEMQAKYRDEELIKRLEDEVRRMKDEGIIDEDEEKKKRVYDF